ncbi:flagellar basal-body MS-ring/collar protein FliF [Clostridium luticellarii]|jgi:flagellar M-ring protein FliF|uniref:flagellar basal-body MS-ring/collar protein FliF n=1 Tax=Clostridium luticellarii TaxID=1691940 RepID=UPI0023564D7C|nr:flagellar basal-body MS-ring/collar protein FliF [Clostridium luticellarii]MCI1943671.1 flagellar M-ring protein FliF [Clostridium luticellarii]MCI1968922.1 flagellar M-ring protein FliF [Clostridium luticellarii]MCI1994299.1 flagellar M-ring protein FliF [Clostridium luticellarii]MCI2038748.1 flagellar M-ring protein FliF [Clostridium luticellarii]
MDKLSQFLKNLMDRWKNLSRNKKIAFGVIAAGLIAAVIFGGVSLGKKKYAVLFSNMNQTDSAAVYKKLQDDKVDVKVEGNSILVPKDEVDSDRMKVLSEVQLTNGSQGFELFDKTNLGTTDAEIKVNYQRALQGELERTIKALPQVQDARVHLVLPDDTEFVKDTQPGSASVTLKLKSGQQLSQDQVKALVALVSGGVKNIPKENVQVIDDKMNLLSKNLYQDENGNAEDSTVPAEKQQQLKQQYEKDMEKRLLSMLETVYGKNKVQVQVNADLDFDAVQQDATTYDPNRTAVVSEHTINSTNTGGTDNAGASPVDNNMSNTINTTGNNGNSTNNEVTRNYDVSKVEQKTVKAPGSVKRLTASVALDGNVDDATRTAIRNLAVSAIGYDANRGDTVSVEAIPFDTTAQDNAQKDMNAMNQAEQQARRNRLFAIIGGIAAAVIAAIVGVILWRRKHEEEDLFDEEMEPQSIDTVVGDETQVEDKPKFNPLELEKENEDTHIENEIKKYAKNKPDQVVDIIKSWMAEDER